CRPPPSSRRDRRCPAFDRPRPCFDRCSGRSRGLREKEERFARGTSIAGQLRAYPRPSHAASSPGGRSSSRTSPVARGLTGRRAGVGSVLAAPMSEESRPNNAAPSQKTPRVISVGGGPGGAGKSLLTVNLGVYLAQL